MSLNATPSGERTHIGIFGRTNAGKSSLINALTSQTLAVVSSVAGTTTDPVSKAMEILPLGPVLLTDTAGLDDKSELGEMRVSQSLKVLNSTDIALVVIDAQVGISQSDNEFIEKLKGLKTPFIIVMNKSDKLDEIPSDSENTIYVSAENGYNINKLREAMAKMVTNKEEIPVVRDLLKEGDLVVLVIPIDESAPKGRLILPQQQTIRDILEAGAVAVSCRDSELEATLKSLSKKPAMVITDSQAFKKVSEIVPEDIQLTSFSILMARHKGGLKNAVKGVTALDSLNDGDKILIAEGCTHHRQCNDIGTVKLPNMILKYTGKNLEFSHSSGKEFPEDLSEYKMVVHCGGCTLNEREMKHRNKTSLSQNIPITNYGITIAQCTGILKRSVMLFPDIYSLL
ncbi:MAG: [Oscillospiraceae bacterium]|nr:[FeFe] hydrogenase H-cluster maturation GTPase HydF [Oscillospiraceae bacterium]